MKLKNSKPLITLLFLVALLISIFPFIFPVKGDNDAKINLSYEKTISIAYNHYSIQYLGETYTFNTLIWSFSSFNSTKITVLAMDRLNYYKFDYNISSVKYYTLSDGTKVRDNGMFSIPYDDYWVVIFYNNDSAILRSDIIITIDSIMNPFVFIVLPILIIAIVIVSFLGISLYFKRIKEENVATSVFCIFFMFLIVYFYIYIIIILNLQYFLRF